MQQHTMMQQHLMQQQQQIQQMQQQQHSAFQQYNATHMVQFRGEPGRMNSVAFQRGLHSQVMVGANPSMPMSRVDFSFPEINSMHQQLALRAQSELSESLEKAQKVYDQVMRQRFQNQAMKWTHAQSSLAPKRRNESHNYPNNRSYGSTGRKASSFRKSRSKQSSFGKNRKGAYNNKISALRASSNKSAMHDGVTSRNTLSKERKLAIQALHAALSGQEVKMLEQLQRGNGGHEEGLNAGQQHAHQDEVGFSNYARRGAGKSPLSRAGKCSLTNQCSILTSSAHSAADTQDLSGELRRTKSATTIQPGSRQPHIFYDDAKGRS